jgi:DEAD/DEAH box helicase domain-containing protein
VMEIAEYCCYDVKITKLVHEYGSANKQVLFKNRLGVELCVPVEW